MAVCRSLGITAQWITAAEVGERGVPGTSLPTPLNLRSLHSSSQYDGAHKTLMIQIKKELRENNFHKHFRYHRIFNPNLDLFSTIYFLSPQNPNEAIALHCISQTFS